MSKCLNGKYDAFAALGMAVDILFKAEQERAERGAGSVSLWITCVTGGHVDYTQYSPEVECKMRDHQMRLDAVFLFV